MKRLLLLGGLLGLLACAPVPEQGRAVKGWTCIIDVAGDSQCRVVPCEQLQSLCTSKHRILKNYVALKAIAYLPTTDYRQCMKNAKDQ